MPKIWAISVYFSYSMMECNRLLILGSLSAITLILNMTGI